MPRFLVSVLLLTLATTCFTVWILTTQAPDTPWIVSIFLINFFFNCTAALSLLCFVLEYKKAARRADLRQLYRKCFKFSALLSAVVVSFMGLKALNALNPVVALIALALILVLYKFRKG